MCLDTISLLAYPKKQNSPAPGLHFFSCGAFSVKSVFHISSSQVSTSPHWTLCLSHPAWPISTNMVDMVKPWWLHRKINRSKANQPESPKELQKLLSQPNQLKKGCRQVKKSPDRASPDTLQTQCKVYGHSNKVLQINVMTAGPYIISFHFS